MHHFYVATPEVRAKLKEPFGILIQGSFLETITSLEVIIRTNKPSRIISVGDAVSKNLHESCLIPELTITDNRQMRKKIRPQFFPDKLLVQVKNPAGRITQEAISAVQEAMKSKRPIHILVEGEEDLLTLITVLYAPENALVIYGQPNEGMVVVRVTPERRAKAQEILELMKSK